MLLSGSVLVVGGVESFQSEKWVTTTVQKAWIASVQKKKVFAYVALSLFHHYSRHETHYSCPSQAPLSPSWDTMVQCKVYTVLYSTGTP